MSAGSWYAQETDVFTNHKTLDVADIIGEDDTDLVAFAFVGALCWQREHLADGDLGAMRGGAFAKAVHWRGKAGGDRLRAAMQDVGFLTVERPVVVANFAEGHKRLLAVARQAKYRARVMAARDANVTERDADVTESDALDAENSQQAHGIESQRGPSFSPGHRQAPGTLSTNASVTERHSRARVDSDSDSNNNKRPNKPSPEFAGEFGLWWDTYGKVGSRADAEALYGYWRQHNAPPGELLAAAATYRRWCESTDTAQKHGATFLAKTPNRWQEWAAGGEHRASKRPGQTTAGMVAEAQAILAAKQPKGLEP